MTTDEEFEEMLVSEQLVLLHDDKKFTRLMRMSIATAAFSLIMLLSLFPLLNSSFNNGERVEEGNQLAACRSEIWADVALAQSEADALLLEALSSFQTDGVAGLSAQGQIDAEDLAEELRIAHGNYRAAVEASRSSPERFLSQCESNQGVFEP